MGNGGTNGRNRMWEEEMLGQYLVAFHPNDRVFHRVRLGPHVMALGDVPLSAPERNVLANAFRRWADAVIVQPDRLLIVETKLIPDPRDVGQLLTYLVLINSTPELQEFLGRPVKGRLVWATDDSFTRQVAVRAGLEVVLFQPSHWREYVEVLYRRQNAPRKARPAVVGLPEEQIAEEVKRVVTLG